ncbi:hypothetical protein C8R46DRAFT_830484, partial [Mycena filopes]
PSAPQIFHGRESQLADIVQHFYQGTPNIAILGAGGMGKTSLARAVLHHEDIIAKYSDHRYFIPCESTTTKEELGCSRAKTLLKQLYNVFLPVHLLSMVILDNLETLWEPVDSRKEIEELLSLLTDVTDIALMITMRGAERPSKVHWTRPCLSPLEPLAQEAARQVFVDIVDDKHSMAELDQILCLTDNMPLVITLLAHVVDVEGLSEVVSRWGQERTGVISEGYDRRSNLESSISLSLISPRVTSVPHSQDLLSLISLLPDGLSESQLKQIDFGLENILRCKSTLIRTALAYSDHNRLKVLGPIREHIRKVLPPAEQMLKPLLKHYQEL